MRSNLGRIASIETVAVVGLGYIGLPTAAMFSQHYEVLGVDVNLDRVRQIEGGSFQSEEPGLSLLVENALSKGKLTVTSKFQPADAFIIAVPTPLSANREAVLDSVNAAVDSVCTVLNGGELIVIESTCPPGTTADIAERIATNRPDLLATDSQAQDGYSLLVDIAYCPERILPGNAIEELRTNDRIVGGLSVGAAERARNLYRCICQGDIRITDSITAELSKLVENAYRDVNIAFANEVSMVCDELGADVWELISLANQHPRVNVLKPGTGVGGHCIAVDPWFIIRAASQARLMETARAVNDTKPLWVANRVQERITETGSQTVALFGLSFKADIDDFRESPAIVVMNTLAERNPSIDFIIVEPHLAGATLAEFSSFPNLRIADAEDALEKADLAAILVDHRAFESLNWSAAQLEIMDFRGVRK